MHLGHGTRYRKDGKVYGSASVFGSYSQQNHHCHDDWNSAYADLAGRIVSLAKKPSPSAPDAEPEYAATSEPAD
jgi:hypothetical protein